MPVARLPKLSDRTSGVLLHPTSLPGGPDGGQLDGEARGFVDFLAAAGQSWWQMLPVGPTGYANSPYSAQSAFAGNPALIDSERLVVDGYLSEKDRRLAKSEQLANAFREYLGSGARDPDFQAFVKEARPWLEDFALYRAIKRLHGEVQWALWPAPLRDRDPAALKRFRAEHPQEIEFVRFMIRSYHYAAFTALLESAVVRTEDRAIAAPWADAWYRWVSAAFLRAYLDTTVGAPFLPAPADLEVILGAHVLQKAFHELRGELDHCAETISIPLSSIIEHTGL